VDLKNAAFVKMRDSVSFCKQILIEYVLKNLKWVVGPLYMAACWSVRGWREISHDFNFKGVAGFGGLVGSGLVGIIYLHSSRLVVEGICHSIRELV